MYNMKQWKQGILLRKKVKYLGLTLDTKLIYKIHVQNTIIARKYAGVWKVRLGLKLSKFSWDYLRVIAPIVTYGPFSFKGIRRQRTDQWKTGHTTETCLGQTVIGHHNCKWDNIAKYLQSLKMIYENIYKAALYALESVEICSKIVWTTLACLGEHIQLYLYWTKGQKKNEERSKRQPRKK